MSSDKFPTQYLPLYLKGKQAVYNNRQYTINHVTINGYGMMVHLIGLDASVNVLQVEVELTAVNINRVP